MLGSTLWSKIFTSASLNPSNPPWGWNDYLPEPHIHHQWIGHWWYTKYKNEKNKRFEGPRTLPCFCVNYLKLMKVHSLMRAIKETEFRKINIMDAFSKGWANFHLFQWYFPLTHSNTETRQHHIFKFSTFSCSHKYHLFFLGQKKLFSSICSYL